MNHTSKTSLVLAITFALAPLFASAAAPLQCTFLTVDLHYGDTNAKTGSQVILLQNFLSARGYLTSTPNGNFGPATVAAVKSFQSGAGIQTTGTAGPLTRAAIQRVSCTQTATPTTPQTSTPSPNPTSPVVPSVGTPNRTVTTPSAGQSLTAGSSIDITWKTPLAASYDLLLEDQYGSSVGRITSRNSGSSYTWTVGNVYSPSSRNDITVPPGTYRIRVQNAAGVSSLDQISEQFTIAAPPITVSTFMPQTVRNNATDAVVLYGSGFDVATSVFFDVLYGPTAPILYLSTDGKVLVFAVPTNVPAGTHSIAIKNQYTTVSSVASILVKDATVTQ